MCFYLHFDIHLHASRLTPPVGGASFYTDQWQYYNFIPCVHVSNNFIQKCTDWEKLEKLQMAAARTNCLIPFKLTVFITDTYRCLYINFLINWISLKVIKLTRWGHSCVLWFYRNTMHLEVFKNIDLKCSNEWFLSIAHVLLFTLQYCCLRLASPSWPDFCLTNA